MTDPANLYLTSRAFAVLITALQRDEARLEMIAASVDDADTEADALNDLGYVRALRTQLQAQYGLVVTDELARAGKPKRRRSRNKGRPSAGGGASNGEGDGKGSVS